jgi:hypothetical protein
VTFLAWATFRGSDIPTDTLLVPRPKGDFGLKASRFGSLGDTDSSRGELEKRLLIITASGFSA